MLCVLIGFLIILAHSLGQEVSEGLPCETPDQIYGTCINLKNCPLLLDVLVKQSKNSTAVNHLRASVCRVTGQTPWVCCPQARARNVEPELGGDVTEAPRDSRVVLPRPPECGILNKGISRVVNGKAAKLGEFPWIVALGYRNTKNPEQPKWLCGGSLITDRHVLTAAHCVHQRKDLYLARLGELDLYSDDDGASPVDIPFVKAKIHEEFDNRVFVNDIAILTLAHTPIGRHIFRACLPLDEPLRSHNLIRRQTIVAGWGALFYRGPSSSKLMYTTLPVQTLDKCQQAYNNKTLIDKRVLCVGKLSGHTDACQGDSGGPLMIGNTANDRYIQIGVVSYGMRCAEAGFPGVYTKVGEFIDWIERNLD